MKVVHDWEAVEHDYRAGILSLREIAGQHNISHTAVRKRAASEGWTRDLNARIQAKAEELVSRSMVSTEVSKSELATERQIVEANAERIAFVRSEHRQDIEKLRQVAKTMLEQIENNDLSLKEGSVVLRSLADTIKTIIGLEREAYGIDKATPEAIQDDKPPIDMMDAVRRFAFILSKPTLQ